MFFLQVLSSFPLPVDKDCEITTQPYSAVHRRPEVGWFLIFAKGCIVYICIISCIHYAYIHSFQSPNVLWCDIPSFQSQCASVASGEGSKRNNTESETQVTTTVWLLVVIRCYRLFYCLLMVQLVTLCYNRRLCRTWCPGNPDCDDPKMLCQDLVDDYHSFQVSEVDQQMITTLIGKW